MSNPFGRISGILRGLSRLRPRLVRVELLGRSLVVTDGTIREKTDYDDAWFLACAAHAGVIFDVGANRGDMVLLALLCPDVIAGPRVKRFEQEFGAAVGGRHSEAVNPAIAALDLAIDALGLNAGKAVIVPTITFAGTASISSIRQRKSPPSSSLPRSGRPASKPPP